MARRKRYSRTNLIIVLIIACAILIYFLSRNTFSLFESEIEGSSDTDVAFYVFNIGKDKIIECTYDNVYVEMEEKNTYKVVYDDDSYNILVFEKGKYYFDSLESFGLTVLLV